MGNEIEAKYPVSSHHSVRRHLRDAGAVFVGTYVQTDRFFDSSGQAFRKNGSGLRLRCLRIVRSGAEKLDPRPEITFKGPVQHNKSVKIRREIQTRIESPRAAREILHACGLQEVMCFQKRRSSYRLGRCLVELDRLPLLGLFVEIEGPSEKAIESVKRKLDIHADHISASYLQLLKEECKQTGASPDSLMLDSTGDRK